MLTSLALAFLLGLAAAALCSRIGLPRIIGMLLTGILIGPYVLNWLDDSILSISSDLRQMALIIILIKAGLSLDLSDLKRVGRPAVMMACVPASCEILAFFLLAPHILGINRIEAAVMGAVLGAVSPAVVVPRMVQLMEEKRGTGQGIPQMILAGAFQNAARELIAEPFFAHRNRDRGRIGIAAVCRRQLDIPSTGDLLAIQFRALIDRSHSDARQAGSRDRNTGRFVRNRRRIDRAVSLEAAGDKLVLVENNTLALLQKSFPYH